MKLPSKQTLKKYGLTLDEWVNMYNKQGGLCKICEASFDDRRACIDHKHVRGWKKMDAEKRKLYVRSLLCYQCNRLILQKSNTLKRLKAAVIYLEEFESI